MVFSSIIFVIWFLPLFLICYFGVPYLIPNKNKIVIYNGVLLVASLIFYAWDTPKFLFVMLFSILMNYCFGMFIDKTLSERGRKFELFLGVSFNLLLLGYFKYSNFFIGTLNQVLESNIPNINVVLPIGISFFTFQGLSYVIDVYRKTVKVQKNPLKVALYISMFPQLVAGPIVRYDTICKQINDRRISYDNLVIGLRRFIYGLAKKVLIANILGETADKIFSTEYFSITHMPMSVAWLGAICYTMQIYFDFSGYSDMAIGLGKILGFDFLENFNYPYISKSITEFWRRWHISLSSFFRDYVYIPMGGNRKGNVYLHLAIVFLLTGLWHGASWTFVLWGAYHGALILLERKMKNNCNFKGGDWWNYLKNLYTMILVTIGWVIFRIEDIHTLIIYLKTMFGLHKAEWIQYEIGYYADRRTLFVLLIAIFLSYNLRDKLKEKRLKYMSDKTIEILQDVFSVMLF